MAFPIVERDNVFSSAAALEFFESTIEISGFTPPSPIAFLSAVLLFFSMPFDSRMLLFFFFR